MGNFMWTVQKTESFVCMLLSQLLFFVSFAIQCYRFLFDTNKFWKPQSLQSQKNKPGSTNDSVFPVLNSPLASSWAVSVTSLEEADLILPGEWDFSKNLAEISKFITLEGNNPIRYLKMKLGWHQFI